MRHIITLSSVPPRFPLIGHALKALLAQTSRPEAVELYIPRSYRRFPQWSGNLPEVPEGVRIVRVEEDLGPATKVLPAVRAYRGQNIEILYVDDDVFFAADWAAASLKLRPLHPNTVICAVAVQINEWGYDWTADDLTPRAVRNRGQKGFFGRYLRRKLRKAFPRYSGDMRLTAWGSLYKESGYGDVAEGFGGVMVRPDFFDDAVFDIPPVLWAVDDFWLSGHLARRGIPIWVDRSVAKMSMIGDLNEQFALNQAVLDGVDRKAANRACIDYMRETYGIWGGTAAIST